MTTTKSAICRLLALALVLSADGAIAASSEDDPSCAFSIRQITGKHLREGDREHPEKGPADPARYVTADGRVQIWGTGYIYLEYKNWKEMREGVEPEPRRVRLLHPDGTEISGEEQAWDLLPHRWPDDGGELEVLYAGVITPTGDRKFARWPEDNWNRRIYAFRRHADGDTWIRDGEPLFSPPLAVTWLDHCYGHHFLTDEDGTTWLYYEKVTEEGTRANGETYPLTTEMFARKMETPFRAAAEEFNLMPGAVKRYPAAVRSVGGFLVEGPRPFTAIVPTPLGPKRFYFIGFSGGDFPTDGYSIHVAVSERPNGPFTPIVEGGDLKDHGRELRITANLSWGPARPHFFPDEDGEWWVLFHAVDKAILPGNNYAVWPPKLEVFHRNVYFSPVTFMLDREGKFTATIGKRGS